MISAAIIAHPSRKKYVRELQRMLDRDVAVIWDQKSDMWDTARRALLSFDRKADYHVIIDDDALPPPNFLEGVERMLTHLPQPSLVGLFVGEDIRLPYLLSGHKGHGGVTPLSEVSFLQLAGVLNWGVATCIPTPWIRGMVKWCDQLDFPEVDRRMGTYAAVHHYPTFYTWPSLVNHREGPSLRNASFRRVALYAPDIPATEHDWTGQVLSLPFDSRRPYTSQEMNQLRRLKRATQPHRQVLDLVATLNLK